MTLRFFATLRAIVGSKHVDFDVPQNASVQELLDRVLERFPELRADVLDEAGCLSRRCHLLVNGRSVVYLEDGLETRLTGEEEIDFFPAVAGG